MKVHTTIRNVQSGLKTLGVCYPITSRVILTLALSWVFAVCEQIALPLPFNPVPLIILHIPLYFLTLTLGWSAVHAYALYLVQIAVGAPFMAYGLGGLARLMGPTGGYLVGLLFAAAIVATFKKHFATNLVTTSLLVLVAQAVHFSLGITQLSLFVPTDKLLMLGLMPFLIGDFGIKVVVVAGLYAGWRYKVKS